MSRLSTPRSAAGTQKSMKHQLNSVERISTADAVTSLSSCTARRATRFCGGEGSCNIVSELSLSFWTLCGTLGTVTCSLMAAVVLLETSNPDAKLASFREQQRQGDAKHCTLRLPGCI